MVSLKSKYEVLPLHKKICLTILRGLIKERPHHTELKFLIMDKTAPFFQIPPEIGNIDTYAIVRQYLPQ